MNVQLWQIILVTLYAGIISWERVTLYTSISMPVVAGFIEGCILGDPTTGLIIGGTLELMSLGVGSYGGAITPDYPLAAMVATPLAIMTGEVELMIPIAATCAAVFSQCRVLCYYVCTFFNRGASKAVKDGDYKKFDVMVKLGIIPLFLWRGLPTFLALVFGADMVQGIVTICPDWLLTGLKTAAGLSPAIGVAVLMKTLPVKDYIGYLVLGFVAASYFGTPMLGVALIGAALAIIQYKKGNTLATNGGNDYDE